jgi:hypothetical protein
MSAPPLVCWKCGASLAALTLPLQRDDECRVCSAQLHVCKLCGFYDPAVARQCREPIADEVKDKDRANFCGYFTPRANAWSDTGQAAGVKAKSALEALFGLRNTETSSRPEADRIPSELKKLFGE